MICAVTIMINMTQLPWNDFDMKSKMRAEYVCKTDARYTDTPCLKKFYKTGFRDYSALCGFKTKKKAQ